MKIRCWCKPQLLLHETAPEDCSCFFRDTAYKHGLSPLQDTLRGYYEKTLTLRLGVNNDQKTTPHPSPLTLPPIPTVPCMQWKSNSHFISSVVRCTPPHLNLLPYLRFTIFEILPLMVSYNHCWPGGSPDINVIAFTSVTLNLVDTLES